MTLFDKIAPEISPKIKVDKLNTIPFTPLDIKTNNIKGNLEDTRPNYISIDEDKKYGEDGIGKITCYNCGEYVKDLGSDNFIKRWNECCKTGGGKYNQQYFKKRKPYINRNPIPTTKEQRKKWKEQQKHIEKNKNNFIMNKKFLEENINKIDNQTIQFGQINQLWPKIRSASRNREWSKGLVYLLLAFSILTASTTLDETTQQPGVGKLHVSIPGAIGDNVAFERRYLTDPRTNNYKDNNRKERRHRQEINKLREKLEKKLAEKKGGKRKTRRKQKKRKTRRNKRKNKRKLKKKTKRKKTRRKRGRGVGPSKMAKVALAGSLLMSSTAALKTGLPSRTAFNDARFQLGRVCSTSQEGKQLMRKVGLQFHPDRYAVALKPQATKYMQELTEVFGNGSCGRKSTSSNRNSRGRKNKPKRTHGKSSKKAKKQQQYEDNTIRNAGLSIGIVVTATMVGFVRKAQRAYRIGYIQTHKNDNYTYTDTGGMKHEIGTKHFILYVKGLLVREDLREHIEDMIDIGEWVLDQAERGL